MPFAGRRLVWLIVVALLLITAAGLVWWRVRSGPPAAADHSAPAPAFGVLTRPDGRRVTQLDEAALAQWCRRHELPELPPLASMEIETAALLYETTRAAAAGRTAESLARLGAVYHGNGYTERAIACYVAAVRADPGAARCWHLLGLARAETGDSAGAIQAYRQSTQLAPKYAPGFARLAPLLADARLTADAFTAWQSYVDLRPNDAIGHLGLGKLAFASNEPAPASEHLSKAVALDPQNQQAHYLLGRVLDRLGESQAAQEHFRRAASITETSAAALSDPWRDEMFALSKSTAALQELLLSVWRRGHLDEAYRIGFDIVARRPDDFVMYRNVAILASKTGKPEEAIRHARRSIQLNPSYLPGHTTLAEILRDQDRFDEAVSAVENALQLDGHDATVLLVRGSIYLRAKRYAEALADLDRGLVLQPEHGNGHAMRAVALLGLNRPTEALDALRRAEQLMPESAWVREQIAALAAQGVRSDGR
jgi:tetratricopeptide (TPR) repeat protein